MCTTCGGKSANHHSVGAYIPKKANVPNPFKVNSFAGKPPRPMPNQGSFGTPMIKSTSFSFGKRR